jgi:hypothetical protein
MASPLTTELDKFSVEDIKDFMLGLEDSVSRDHRWHTIKGSDTMGRVHTALKEWLNHVEGRDNG